MFKILIPVFTVGLLFLNSCTTSPSGGTEVENERFTARIIDSDGKPVSGATVTILPVDYIPNATALAKLALTTIRQTTEDDGTFSAADLDAGCYNVYAEKGDLAAYGDSVYITASGIDIKEIVLKEKGSITGYVQVQPNHDPRIVEVQILGTHLYTNVDSDGRYSFPEIALGTYLLRGSANEDGYIPTYREVNTDPPSASEEYPNLITMLYTGIPIIENITAVFSQETQLVTLSWDAATYRDLYEYVIFRDREGTTQPGTQPIAVTTETTWIDSTASEDNSSTAPFRYRVVIRDNGMELGPSHGFSRVEVPYYELTAYFSADVDSVFPDEEIELYLMATSSPTAIKNVLFFTGNDILYENTFTEDDSVFEYENNPITITVPESDSPWFILECSVENFDGLTSYDSLLLKYMHEDSDPDPAPLVPDTVDTPDETSFNTDVQTETDIRIVPVFMSPERNSEFHYRTIANLKSIEQKRIIFDSKQKTDRV